MFACVAIYAPTPLQSGVFATYDFLFCSAFWSHLYSAAQPFVAKVPQHGHWVTYLVGPAPRSRRREGRTGPADCTPGGGCAAPFPLGNSTQHNFWQRWEGALARRPTLSFLLAHWRTCCVALVCTVLQACMNVLYKDQIPEHETQYYHHATTAPQRRGRRCVWCSLETADRRQAVLRRRLLWPWPLAPDTRMALQFLFQVLQHNTTAAKCC